MNICNICFLIIFVFGYGGLLSFIIISIKRFMSKSISYEKEQEHRNMLYELSASTKHILDRFKIKA